MPIAIRIAAVTILVGAASPWLQAQPPQFEVATIKLNQTGSGGSNVPRLKNGTLVAENISLLMLLQAAYDLSAVRIVGPNWLDADRFDLAGKSPQGVPDTELMPMLQELLKDRFQLSSHREMKEMPVFEMLVGKDGLKMSAFDPAQLPAPRPANRNRGGAMVVGSGTMPQLAKIMSGPAGKPVLDKTELPGRYNYTLSFTPLSAQAAESAPDAPPDLFTAVQQQLGLKLESKKEPIEVLVIDHAERTPIGN